MLFNTHSRVWYFVSVMLCDHEYQPIKSSVQFWILDTVVAGYFVWASRTSCIKQKYLCHYGHLFLFLYFAVYSVQQISSTYFYDAWTNKAIRSQNTLFKHCTPEVYDWWQEEMWSVTFYITFHQKIYQGGASLLNNQWTAGNALVRIQHGGYWCPGAAALDYEYPQCW